MRTTIFVISLFLISKVWGQNDHDQRPVIEHSDTSHVHSIKEFFSEGELSGHFRHYFMSTLNEGALSDYYANAVGRFIKYESSRWNGFKVGVGGNFIYNLYSSNLMERDELSHRTARFERQLFDITDPENHHDLDRLEELYINYRRKRISLTLGKQSIYSPLVNPQDGRMKPYVLDGLWVDYAPAEGWL